MTYFFTSANPFFNQASVYWVFLQKRTRFTVLTHYTDMENLELSLAIKEICGSTALEKYSCILSAVSSVTIHIPFSVIYQYP